MLSLLYLVAYTLQAVAVLGVGVLATAGSLGAAVGIAAVVLAVVCVTVLALLLVDRRAGAA